MGIITLICDIVNGINFLDPSAKAECVSTFQKVLTVLIIIVIVVAGFFFIRWLFGVIMAITVSITQSQQVGLNELELDIKRMQLRAGINVGTVTADNLSTLFAAYKSHLKQTKLPKNVAVELGDRVAAVTCVVMYLVERSLRRPPDTAQFYDLYASDSATLKKADKDNSTLFASLPTKDWEKFQRLCVGQLKNDTFTFTTDRMPNRKFFLLRNPSMSQDLQPSDTTDNILIVCRPVPDLQLSSGLAQMAAARPFQVFLYGGGDPTVTPFYMDYFIKANHIVRNGRSARPTPNPCAVIFEECKRVAKQVNDGTTTFLPKSLSAVVCMFWFKMQGGEWKAVLPRNE